MNNDLQNKPKQIPIGIPSFLNNIYRLIGYEDNSSRNSPESKQQYSSAFKELKKELLGDVVDNNMLTIHFYNSSIDSIKSDKTVEEILNAISQGKNMVGYYEYDMYGSTLILRPCDYNLKNDYVAFTGINAGYIKDTIEIVLLEFWGKDSTSGKRIRKTI